MTVSRVGRVVVTMLAIGLVLGAAPAASASVTGDTTTGGCRFAGVDGQPAVNGDEHGVIADVSATADASGQLTDATVSCWIEVDGVEAPGTRLDTAGPGVEVGAKEISFAASSSNDVAVCQAVAYADGSVELTSCRNTAESPWPCSQDLLTTCVDWMVCPYLAAHGGAYGPVTIGPDGDVDVPDPLGLGLNPFYDCPPYTPVSSPN